MVYIQLLQSSQAYWLWLPMYFQWLGRNLLLKNMIKLILKNFKPTLLQVFLDKFLLRCYSDKKSNEVNSWTHIFSQNLIWIWNGLHSMIISHLAGLYLYIHFGIDNYIFPYVYNGVSSCRYLHRLFLYSKEICYEII